MDLRRHASVSFRLFLLFLTLTASACSGASLPFVMELPSAMKQLICLVISFSPSDGRCRPKHKRNQHEWPASTRRHHQWMKQVNEKKMTDQLIKQVNERKITEARGSPRGLILTRGILEAIRP